MKICHLTSVHPRYDGRIFRKQCQSLLAAGYDVSLVVADGKGDELKDGVKIYDVGKFEGRFNRIQNATSAVGRKAAELNCEIYHFHDPELIFAGLSLKKKGKKVVFDMHENVPADIEEKAYIPFFLRKFFSFLYLLLETYVVKRIDAVVSTRESINKRISKYNRKIELITNFPIVDQNVEIVKDKENALGFAGVIIPNWRHAEIINSLGRIENVSYSLAGDGNIQYIADLKKLPGWSKVDYLGKIPFESVRKLYEKTSIGVAIYIYCKNMDGNTGNLANTKLFEYMNWGIPVICTDYTLWKQIIEDEVNCGICVNPYDESAIEAAIRFLIDNPETAYQMGVNGRKAVLEKYNWETQAQKLVKLYASL